MRLVVGRRPRQRSEHNGLPASRIRGIRAPTEGRVSKFSWSKIAGGGQTSQLSTGVSGSYNHHEAVARAKLLEIKGHEVFRVDRLVKRAGKKPWLVSLVPNWLCACDTRERS